MTGTTSYTPPVYTAYVATDGVEHKKFCFVSAEASKQAAEAYADESNRARAQWDTPENVNPTVKRRFRVISFPAYGGGVPVNPADVPPALRPRARRPRAGWGNPRQYRRRGTELPTGGR